MPSFRSWTRSRPGPDVARSFSRGSSRRRSSCPRRRLSTTSAAGFSPAARGCASRRSRRARPATTSPGWQARPRPTSCSSSRRTIRSAVRSAPCSTRRPPTSQPSSEAVTPSGTGRSWFRSAHSSTTGRHSSSARGRPARSIGRYD